LSLRETVYLKHFKADQELTAENLTSIWEEINIPNNWTKGIIIQLAKKQALSDCNNG